MHNVYDLTPDGYSRFFIMADCILHAYGKDQLVKILDVGGASEYFQLQLKKLGLKYDLTILDQLDKPSSINAKYIKSDATNMDLKDGSFDVVVSTDTLEHIPNEKKWKFIEECIRVGRDLCIIAAPFNTTSVNDAEKSVNKLNKKLFGQGQPWLEEHFLYSKPDISLVGGLLKKHKTAFDDFGSQNIDTWLLNSYLNLIEAKLGLNIEKHTLANRYYNHNIFDMTEFDEPTYRHFFVIYLNESMKNVIDVSRYATSDTNNKRIEYIAKLMELVADRIEGLNNLNLDLTEKLKIASQNLEKSDRQINALKKLVQSQAETIDKVQPILKLARKKPIKIVYGKIANKSKQRRKYDNPD